MSPKPICIDWLENARLVRLSSQHGVLSLAFGPGWVGLAQDAAGVVESTWALPYLAEWRGISVQDGGGI